MILTFDPPEVGWTLNSSAIIVPDATAPTQPNSLLMTWGIFGVNPSARRNLSHPSLVVGRQYPIWAKFNFDPMGYPPLVFLRVIYNNGSGLDSGAAKTATGVGWEARNLGTMTYDIANGIFQIVGTVQLGFLGAAFVDEIHIGDQFPEPLTLPENGKTPHGGRQWFVDDVSGTLHPDDEQRTDDYSRIRARELLEEPDRDYLQEGYRIRTERTLDPL